jgi:hypothetical protein
MQQVRKRQERCEFQFYYVDKRYPSRFLKAGKNDPYTVAIQLLPAPTLKWDKQRAPSRSPLVSVRGYGALKASLGAGRLYYSVGITTHNLPLK